MKNVENQTNMNVIFTKLLQKLQEKKAENEENYNYYHSTQPVVVSTEKNSKEVNKVLHSGSAIVKKEIDKIYNRLNPCYFSGDENVIQFITVDLLNKLIKDLLVTGSSYVRILKDSTGLSLEVIPSSEFIGIINNPINTISYGVEVSKDQITEIEHVSEYTPFYSLYNLQNNSSEFVQTHELGVCNVVPFLIGQDVNNLLGTSLIDRNLKSLYKQDLKNKYYQNETLKNYAKNQRYLLGVDQSLQHEAAGTALAITKDADGQSPTAGSFNNLNPNDVANALNKSDSSLDDSASSDFIYKIKKIQKDINESFNILCLMVEAIQSDSQFIYQPAKYEIVWESVESLDLMKVGEGIMMINNAMPGYINKNQADKLLGLNGNTPILPLKIEGTTSAVTLSEAEENIKTESEENE